MKIIYGLKNGALLQRDKNYACKCYFKAKARGELKSSLGKIIRNEEGVYVLTGIPVGGPYTFVVSDNDEKIELTDIYVGDLWLLGGQSNMEGAGKMRQKHWQYDASPLQSIRAYYMNDTWDAAKSQLHQLWDCPDPCVSGFVREYRKNSPWGTEFPEVQKDGVGPGLFFAIEMQKRMGGVPQGVIPCGIGGASLAQWKPNTPDNYYASAKRRFYECGSHIKGIFWYQGCSQTSEEGVMTFVEDMKTLVGAMRTDFKNELLPFVQVQIHKYHAAPQASDRWYSEIRELQRTLDKKIENLATVYAVDSELDDLIHLSSESQEKIGYRAAEAMSVLVGGDGAPSPDIDYFEIVEDDYVPFRANIIVHYKNVTGSLRAPGVPSGFFIHEEADEAPIREISRLYVYGNSVRVKVEIPPDRIAEHYLSYGYGNTYYCNITDGADRSIPAFGPLKIGDYLKK